MAGNMEFAQGMTVLVRHGGRSTDSETLAVVEKVTPKGFIRVQGVLYNPNGHSRGNGSWAWSTIRPATQQDIQRIQQANYTRRVLNAMHDCKGLTYEQACAIAQILGLS